GGSVSEAYCQAETSEEICLRGAGVFGGEEEDIFGDKIERGQGSEVRRVRPSYFCGETFYNYYIFVRVLRERFWNKI
ncbi:MAG: hypothetical protein HFG93_01070, partial [Dorea sp.]|nr:hypothetical protein [Dorea sp.]